MRPRAPKLPFALTALAALFAGACSEDSRSSFPPSASTAAGSASPAPPPPGLVAVAYRDANGSRSVDAGDELTLTFDRPVRVGPLDPSRDLEVVPAGTLGAGATGRAGGVDTEVLVTLGVGARLALFDTYRVGVGGSSVASPARLRVSAWRHPAALVDVNGSTVRFAEPALVLAEEGSRLRHQGAAYRDPSPDAARPYYGNLHAHTAYSDGQGTPASALAYARDAAQLDFMCVTDHAEQLTSDEWRLTLAAAAAESRPDRFVALVGYEWNWGTLSLVPLTSCNHINVIGTRLLPSYDLSRTLWSFWDEAQALSLPEGAVGQFNHPSAGITQPAWAVQQGLIIENWSGLSYDARADRLMGLMRVEGRGSAETPSAGYLPALEQGWHVSPQSSQDNHAADWGTANTRRTGVWLATLDEAELMRALREGRTFSSDDRDASIRLLADGELWMGSTVARYGPVALRAEVRDGSGDGFLRVEVLGRNGVLVAVQDLGGQASGAVSISVDPPVDGYYYAHAVQVDGDELFSAPIYVDR